MAEVEAGHITAVMGEFFALEYLSNSLPCTTEVCLAPATPV